MAIKQQSSSATNRTSVDANNTDNPTVITDDKTRLFDGNLVIFLRGGKYQARINLGNNKGYKYVSLKTGNLGEAIQKATIEYTKVGVYAELGMPSTDRKFKVVLDEYLKHRDKEHQQGRTKADNLRHMKRVAKFWYEYAGNKSITSINDGALQDYVQWRKDYYHNIPADKRPNNHRLNPTDKTLQGDVVFCKSVLKWAQQRGYRGNVPYPTYMYKVKKARVRPAFELDEYQKLITALIKWEMGCRVKAYLYTRQLLFDYVTILANTGMRVGEANSLKRRNVQAFVDGHGRSTYRFIVMEGKTGEREVIPYASVADAVKRVLTRNPNASGDDWFFAMKDGEQIITLADQFDAVLKKAGIEHNSVGDKYSLYSLRHFYAVQALREGMPVWDIAKNMGTSVEIIQKYYGKQATPRALADRLGGKATDDI